MITILTKTQQVIKKFSSKRVQDHATSPAPHGLPNPTLVWTNESTCSLCSVTAQLKLHVLSLVQTRVGFGNPCGAGEVA